MAIVPHTEPVDVQIGDRTEDMIHDHGQEGFHQAHAPYYDNLQSDSKKPLYLVGVTKSSLNCLHY